MGQVPFEAFHNGTWSSRHHFTGRKTKAQRGQRFPKVTQPVDRLEPKLSHLDEDGVARMLTTDGTSVQQQAPGSVSCRTLTSPGTNFPICIVSRRAGPRLLHWLGNRRAGPDSRQAGLGSRLSQNLSLFCYLFILVEGKTHT